MNRTCENTGIITVSKYLYQHMKYSKLKYRYCYDNTELNDLYL